MKSAIGVALISFLLLSVAAAALSVTPASTLLNPHDSYPKAFEFSVGNADSEAINIDVTVDGNLKDYIIIDSFDKTVPAGGNGKVKFTVNLPKGITPGNYKSNINAVSKATAGGSVGVKIAVAHVVWFDLLFPGRHIRPNLVVRIFPGNELDVIAQAISDGAENVTGVQITTTVYLPGGAELKTFSGTKDVAVNSSDFVNGQVKVDNPEQGEYKITMSATYDGKTVTAEQTVVLAGAPAPSTVENVATGATAIIAGQDNTVLYALILIILTLLVYIALKKR